MAENSNSINQKTGILLSRNTPVALVVGAAGFLGSNLTDKLLDQRLQVVGVDNFKTGKRENLENAIKNKNFHLIIDSFEEIELDLARLDYLFIVTSEGWNIDLMLKLFKKTTCRCLFVSSIDLYDSKIPVNLRWFKEVESALAKFAHDNHLNARILRLGPVFGPRMHFRNEDPLTRLIQAALTASLQKETVALDFSTRSLYVEDAIDLIIKSMLSGATALKIFDAVSPTPVKVAEVKQILLDPIWHENRGFTPTDLPPWLTPNLEKTMQFLNWRPKVGLVMALKKTLNYFKDHEIKIPEPQAEEGKTWQEDMKEHLATIKGEKETPKDQKVAKKRISLPKFSLPVSKIYLFLALILIFYALIFPVTAVGWGVLTFRYQLTQAAQNLTKGNFDDSLKNVKQAQAAINEAKSIFNSMEPIRKTGFLKKQFEIGDDLANLASLSIEAADGSILGIRALYDGLRSVTGEIEGLAKDDFTTAQIELAQADERLSYAQALVKDEQFKQKLPSFLRPSINSLQQKLFLYNDLIKKGRAASILLSEIVASGGSKNYLILLQNNGELRPTGGFIGSYALISFEAGKLKKLTVNDVYAIDGQLKLHVEPPKEIKEDLGQKDWFLRDANWEPDFPTSARQVEWFYTKETGERVEGVWALDVSAIENLLTVVGSLNLPDYQEKITAENLFEKAISHAEQGFFPGSQAKKSFLTAITNELFNKIFFLPHQDWPGIVQALGRSLESKHMAIYLDDPKLFSYVVSQSWAGTLPRASIPKSGLTDKEGPLQDLLAPVEANLGANKANYYLERRYNLETVIGKEGEIRHRLKINYLNRSPSDTFPAGKYKNRMRIYLPFGARLARALWGETNITKDVTNFVDYGRSGISLLVELVPKEQKNLILDYEIPAKLQFKDGTATYRLDIIKQAGTLKDPLEWKVSYPINYQLVSSEAKKIGPQEQIFNTDLSRDRSFELVFKK